MRVGWERGMMSTVKAKMTLSWISSCYSSLGASWSLHFVSRGCVSEDLGARIPVLKCILELVSLCFC